MRCNICDSILQENEIKYNPRFETFDPCKKCLEEVGDTYSDFDVDQENEEKLVENQVDADSS